MLLCTANKWVDMRLLLVEDDVMVASGIKLGLTDAGYAVDWVGSGERAEEVLRTESFDAAIIDIGLPAMDGLELTRRLRRPDMASPALPVLILTARDALHDRVQGLDLGADDYMVKPFGTRELMARIRAVLRRSSSEARKVVHFSDNEIDFERRIVRRKGEELKLTPAEYNLLCYFLHNPDRPLTRDMILNSVWGYEFFPNTRTVDAHVVKLRQKLEPDTNAPRHFLTVHGVGYRFVP